MSPGIGRSLLKGQRAAGIAAALVLCGALAATPTRARPGLLTPAAADAPVLSTHSGSIPYSPPCSVKKARGPQAPSRRCAALVDERTQCPRNAVEPTNYCERHQNYRERPQKRTPAAPKRTRKKPGIAAAGAAPRM